MTGEAEVGKLGKGSAHRPASKHPDKDVNRVVQRLIAAGWTFEYAGHGYYLLCPCPEKGAIPVASTPKNPTSHARKIAHQAARCPKRHDLDTRAKRHKE